MIYGIIAEELGTAAPSPPPPPRLPAVRIDAGNTSPVGLHWANQAGVADASQITLSVWIKADRTYQYFDAANEPLEFFAMQGNFIVQIDYTDFGDIGVYFLSNNGSSQITFKAAPGTFDDKWGSWHHLFIYADLNFGAHHKITGLMLDGVDVLATVTDTNLAFTISPSGKTLDIPAPSYFNVLEMFDFWLAFGQLETDVALFRDAGSGLPMDLGANGEAPTGTSPTYFFKGDSGTFADNLGTGPQPDHVFSSFITDADTYPGGPAGMTIDGMAKNEAISGTNSGTVSLTTASIDDIIILAIHAEASGAGVTVGSVSDGSALTWHKRSSQTITSPAGYTSDLEIWWAHAGATLSSDTITVSFTGNVDDASILAVAVNGADLASPFDMASSAIATRTSDSPSDEFAPPPEVTGITTIGTSGMLFMVGANADSGPHYAMAPDKGHEALISIIDTQNGGGTNFSYMDFQKHIYFARLVSFDAAFGGTYWSNWIAIADALKHAT